jgi:hypothetical protein
MRYRRNRRPQRPPRPFYDPDTGRELTRAEQAAYWAKRQADAIAECHAREQARRAALTPEEREREDRAEAEIMARLAANWEQEKARRAEREREYWARRNDPYNTFGT